MDMPRDAPWLALTLLTAITGAIYLWAAAHYLYAARHVGADLARVRESAE